MALVGEAGVDGGLGERESVFDRSPREREAAHRSVPVGARPEGPSEVAGEREAVDPCDLFEHRGGGLLACVGGEVVAGELDAPDVDRDRAVVGLAAERAECIGERGGDLAPGRGR